MKSEEIDTTALCPNKETLDALKKGADDELSTVFKNTVDDAFAYAMMADTQQMNTTKGTVSGRTMRYRLLSECTQLQR